MRYRRLKIEGGTYFFTVVTHNRLPIFRDAPAVHLLETVIADVKTRHPFEIDAQVVLPDHLHALWTMPEGDADYSRRWRLIKEAFTRRFRKLPLADAGSAVWQSRFWEHLIRDDSDFWNHLDYIHANPVHHGLVSAPSAWPHSTFASWVDRRVYESDWGVGQLQELPTIGRCGTNKASVGSRKWALPDLRFSSDGMK